MSNEVKPVGESCNLRCRYCYEHLTRDAQGAVRYTRDALLPVIQSLKCQFHLFGGEALLLPIDQLEEIWKIGFEKFKRNGIQTNGTLITDQHIALFKKYCVGVGISIDGPGDLNDVRWAGTLEATRAMTARTEAAIDACLAAGVTPTLIACLHKGNCETDEQLDRMIEWFRDLEAKGIKHINCHLLEDNGHAHAVALPPERMVTVLMRIWNLVSEIPALRQRMLDSLLRALGGDDREALCTFRACDTFNTPSCRGIEADGKPSNCGHTYKDSTVWMPAPDYQWIRQVALYQTPQSEGGCQGCPYWLACFGYCPASGGAVNDWRSRTSHCEVLKALFAEAERRLLAAGFVPVSRDPKREQYEATIFTQLLAGGPRPSVWDVIHPKSSKTRPANLPSGVTYLNHTDYGQPGRSETR